MMTDQELTNEMVTMFSLVVLIVVVGFTLFLFWRRRDAKKRLTPGQIEWLRVQEYGKKPEAQSDESKES